MIRELLEIRYKGIVESRNKNNEIRSELGMKRRLENWYHLGKSD